VKLEALGALTAVAGQSWEGGKRAQATIYNLLPDPADPPVSKQSLYAAAAGFVYLSGAGSPDCCEPSLRPRLSDCDRAVLLATASALSAQKRLAEERWRRGLEEPEQLEQQEQQEPREPREPREPDSAPQFDHLLEPPGPGAESGHLIEQTGGMAAGRGISIDELLGEGRREDEDEPGAGCG
jgi:hypothetical protein